MTSNEELPELGELPSLDTEGNINEGFPELHFAETSETSIDFVQL
ncbi:MAG: hypothetical protein R3E08_10035 [Thiotrichaceae bacterium]